jgi:hypothetical protein
LHELLAGRDASRHLTQCKHPDLALTFSLYHHICPVILTLTPNVSFSFFNAQDIQ